MIVLSNRLQTIADLVPDGACVCDVGTDHGYLPAALYLSGRVRRVSATDIHPKPLAGAQATLSAEKIQGISLYLCDGLAAVSRETVDTVVIAGMGGEVIAGILSRTDWVRDKTVTLILQPTTSAEMLRDFLAQNGFAVEREPAVAENGKVYSVMRGRFCGRPYVQAPAARYIGLVSPQTPAGRLYIEKQYRRCSTCASALKNRAAQAAEYRHYAQAAEALSALLTEDVYAI